MKKKNKRADCVKCGKNYRTKSLHKHKGKLICKQCRNKERKRDGKLIGYIPQKVPKSMLKSYWKKKPKTERKVRPIIHGAKVLRGRSPFLGLSLTKEEKYVLYIKYRKLGYCSQRINKKVNEVVKKLKELVEKLRQEKKPEKEIKDKFKEEFAKLCQMKDVGLGR